MSKYVNLGILAGYDHDVLAEVVDSLPTTAEYVETFNDLPGTWDVHRLTDGRYVVEAAQDPAS